MRTEPLSGIIQLDIKQAQAGVLDMSSTQTAVEYANVLAVGKDVTQVKTGDSVFVKSWAIDTVTHDDVKYYFVSEDTNGLLAIVHND